MYNTFEEFLRDKHKICIIQAENPDGDSLGSAVSLDYLLNDKEISLYCPVDIPQYLHYFDDWSRVTNEFDYKADGYIIVDTAAEILLSKLLEDTAIKNRLYSAPVFVIDHHETEDDLSFPHDAIIEVLPSCTQIIYRIAKELNYDITKEAAEAAVKDLDEANKEIIREAIYQKYITPTQRKANDYVGVEFELPIVNLKKQAVDFDVVHALAEAFVSHFHFDKRMTDDDGYSSTTTWSPGNDE